MRRQTHKWRIKEFRQETKDNVQSYLVVYFFILTSTDGLGLAQGCLYSPRLSTENIKLKGFYFCF